MDDATFYRMVEIDQVPLEDIPEEELYTDTLERRIAQAEEEIRAMEEHPSMVALAGNGYSLPLALISHRKQELTKLKEMRYA